MSVIAPQSLLIVPLLLWLAGGGLWFWADGRVRAVAWIGVVAVASIGLYAARAARRDRRRSRLAWRRLQPTSRCGPSWSSRWRGDSGVGDRSPSPASPPSRSSLLPLVYGWRTILSRNPGKLRTIGYFACLGAGYIMVEVGLIAKFSQALGNATVSASVLITGMLVFSGLGSLASERYLDGARTIMPKLFLAIGAMLIGYGLALDRALEWIGALPYALRLVVCFVLILPPAFLMGLPMPIAMAWLSRLGKDHMFLWAWGINGCFAVVGAALVPVIAVSFGLAAVLVVSGCAYLLAMLGFFAILLPLAAPAKREKPPDVRGRHRLRLLASMMLAAGLGGLCLGMHAPAAAAPTRSPRRQLVAFKASPFPFDGRPRRGRTSRSSTSRRTAGGGRPPRAAAPSTGRTPPTATGACCSSSPRASIRRGRD